MRGIRLCTSTLTMALAVGGVSAVAGIAVPSEAGERAGTAMTCGEPKKLPVPAGADHSFVLAGDPSGRYLVGVDQKNLERRDALLWDHGRLRVLEVPGYDPEPTAVNSDGLVVGHYDEQPDGARVPFAQRDGATARLPGVQSASADGVNERGDIVGTRYDEYGFPVGLVKWPAGSDAPVRLAGPAGSDAEPTDVLVAEDGTAVGRFSGRHGDDHLYAWPSDQGRPVELRLPAGASELNEFVVAGDRVAAGVRDTGAVLWDLDAPREPRVVSERVFVEAVNASGWVGGSILGDDSARIAVLTSPNGRTLRLAGLDSEPSTRLGEAVRAVSDDQRLLGGVSEQGDGQWAVTWTCTP